MIIGIGSDIVDIRRIEQTLERFGARFLERIYTETERRKAESRAGAAATYAKRFAAKEACAKALGTGFRKGVFFRDLGVVNLAGGKPTLALTGVQFTFLIGGTVIVERIFAYPGIGSMAIDAVINRDLPLIQGLVLVFGALFILINLSIDLAVVALNPRLRHG